jgi:hypothetical protein
MWQGKERRHTDQKTRHKMVPICTQHRLSTKNAPRNLQKRTWKFSKFTGIRSAVTKITCISHTCNNMGNLKLKIQYHIWSLEKDEIHKNLRKHIQDCYTEYFKKLMKEIREDLNREAISAPRLGDLTQWRCYFSTNKHETQV